YLYQNPVVARHLDGWLEKWQPDVAHIISCYTLSASAIEALERRAVPMVLTLVDFWFICPRLSLLHADSSLCDGRTTPRECLRCMLYAAKIYRWPRRALPEGAVKHALTWISKHPAISRQRGLRGMALDMTHRKRYLAQILRLPDAIMAPSQALADTVQRAGADIPIRVVHSGHDLSWLASMPQRQPSANVRFGYIGQISSQKGVHQLVTAFLRAGCGDAAQLHVYGDHEQRPEYTESIFSAIPDHSTAVTFHGFFSPDRLGEVLAGIDVLVVPSTWRENNPRVVQEAFAAGVPVIGSDVPGIAEFVEHEANGLLFERANVDDLARQLRRVMDEPRLLDSLRQGIPPVKTVEEELNQLLAIYEAVSR
ncbi:MAG: glycosyltransferase, partial [Thiohalospira sp.]